MIDKPEGWTSHDVVAKVRKLMRTRRVGHTGTLDPFATGVLVVCLNQATRLVQFLTGADKEYLATVRLGFATDTGDLTGTPLEPGRDGRQISTEQFAEALTRFRGKIHQIPPMYSAKKIGGVKLYELARRGAEIERQAIEVNITELELAAAIPCDEDRWRDFEIRVVCSSGTYIRTLAEDIGKALGTGAHLTRLRRTRAGNCTLGQAVTLEQLAEMADTGRVAQKVMSMHEALNLPLVILTSTEYEKVLHGNAIRAQHEWTAGTLLSLCNEDQKLIAVAEYKVQTGSLQPRVVLAG